MATAKNTAAVQRSTRGGSGTSCGSMLAGGGAGAGCGSDVLTKTPRTTRRRRLARAAAALTLFQLRDSDRVGRHLRFPGVVIEPRRVAHHLHRLVESLLAVKRREKGGAVVGV